MTRSILGPVLRSPSDDEWDDERAAFWARCAHEDAQEVRRYIASNGVAHFRVQCLTCGNLVRSIRKADLTVPPDSLPAWDPDLWREYSARRARVWQERAETQRQDRNARWWAWYNAYLDSSSWERRRLAALERDRRRCQAALDGACLGTASQVHHLTYKHIGHEPLFELTSVCKNCHDALTRIDREGRA